MLVLANSDGSTAIPGPMLVGSPNCFNSENTEYGVQATMKAAIMMPTMQVTLRSLRLRLPTRIELCDNLQHYKIPEIIIYSTQYIKYDME